MRDWIADLWHRLNPSEPSPAYLVKFMGAALAVFAIALLIGRVMTG